MIWQAMTLLNPEEGQVFEPWIGSRYGEAGNRFGGRRVLVVGESHYSGHHEIGSLAPQMTQDVMQKYRTRVAENWLRTFDNVAWAVSGKSRLDLMKDGKRGEMDVWEDMALYNYVPVVIARSPQSDRPSPEHFRLGREPFEQVLSEHKPDVLIVCGYELFPWLVHNHHPQHEGNPWHLKGEWIDIPREEPIRAVRMKHPSKFFSHKAWGSVINRALTA
jgi:hypothetical protein